MSRSNRVYERAEAEEKFDQPAAPLHSALVNAPVRYRHAHEVVLQHLLCNPRVTLRELNEATGYSIGYLSVLMRSKGFKERLRELENVEFDEAVLPLKEKMSEVASLALDRIHERLEVNSVGTRQIHEIARDMLAQLYPVQKSGGTAVQVNTQLNLSPEQVTAMAQEVLRRKASVPVLGGVQAEYDPMGGQGD
jgi:hypothetical protein